MGDDALRARILARRAALVAAAVSAVASSECNKPQPCLSVVALEEDGGAPMPCLSAPIRPRDAGAEGTPDGAVRLPPIHLGQDASASAPPAPCLSMVGPLATPTPPRPAPCLSMLPPDLTSPPPASTNAKPQE